MHQVKTPYLMLNDSSIMKVDTNRSKIQIGIATTSRLESLGSISNRQSMGDEAVMDPARKEKQLKEKFNFPINPAYFPSTVIKQPQRLTSLENYCKDKDLALTKKQSIQNYLSRSKKEYKYWAEKFNKIVKGYRDQDFMD